MPRQEVRWVHIAVSQIRFPSECFQFGIVGPGHIHTRPRCIEERHGFHLDHIANLSHNLRPRRLLRIHQKSSAAEFVELFHAAAL